MKVIILSSGVSSRLKPLTDNIHKCLIPLCSKTLIEYQLDAITKVEGIEEIIIIIGHKGELIRSKIGEKYNGIIIKYIENDCYSSKKINYTLSLAKNEVLNQDFIYMEGDLLFHPEILGKLVQNSKPDCLIADKNCQSKKVDTIITGKNDLVESLQFKEHGDFSQDIASISNFIGEMVLLIKFGKELGKQLMRRLDHYGYEGDEKHLYSIFNEIFTENKMNYLTIESVPWVEIDNFEDLKKADSVCKEIWSQKC